MSDKDLLRQLNKLKGIKPDADWRARSRGLLLKKLEASQADSGFIQAFKLSISSLRTISQPVLTVFLIAFIVFGSGFASMKVAEDSKPGDSLYIAKIINEKTQFALTFDEGKKLELGLEFAGNRARELSQVLNSPEDSAKQERVEKLVSNFKKEINLAKTRIAMINRDEGKPDVEEAKEEIIEEATEDSAVFSANLGKDENGVEVFEPIDTVSSEDAVETIVEPEEIEVAIDDETVTSTPDILEASTTTEAAVEETIDPNPEQAISEAKELLGMLDYEATLDKLSEADELIEQVSGQVKGESEAASSTEAVVEEEGEVLGVDEEATSTVDN